MILQLAPGEKAIMIIFFGCFTAISLFYLVIVTTRVFQISLPNSPADEEDALTDMATATVAYLLFCAVWVVGVTLALVHIIMY